MWQFTRQVDLVQGIPQVTVWSAPYPTGSRHASGLVGTTYYARCECGWPQLPAMVDRQTYAEADDESRAHAQDSGHCYRPQYPDDR